jgi:hypothetical protein
MGREVRRVDANWEHPKKQGYFQPMFDQDFDSVFSEWVENYNLWKSGNHPDQKKYPEEKDQPYWEWADIPPDPYYYLAKPFNNPTWYQMYETVSEGTPVSPKFETAGELVDYLVENGDFWDQRRGHGGWNRDVAEKFVGIGWAPSGIMIKSDKGIEFKTARDGA